MCSGNSQPPALIQQRPCLHVLLLLWSGPKLFANTQTNAYNTDDRDEDTHRNASGCQFRDHQGPCVCTVLYSQDPNKAMHSPIFKRYIGTRSTVMNTDCHSLSRGDAFSQTLAPAQAQRRRFRRARSTSQVVALTLPEIGVKHRRARRRGQMRLRRHSHTRRCKTIKIRLQLSRLGIARPGGRVVHVGRVQVHRRVRGRLSAVSVDVDGITLSQ